MAPPFEQTGDVLVAFYSDNLLSSLERTLACAPAVLDEGRLEALEASAAGLRARKEALAAFGERFTVSFDDYVAKKAALDEAEARLRALQDEARAQAEENPKARTPTRTPSGACWTRPSPNAPRRRPRRRLPRRRGSSRRSRRRRRAGTRWKGCDEYCVSCDGGNPVHPLPAMAAVTRALPLASVSYSTLAAIATSELRQPGGRRRGLYMCAAHQ